MPRGTTSKIEKRLAKGFNHDNGVRGKEKREDIHNAAKWLGELEFEEQLANDFWLPHGDGWAAKQKLWDKTWPRTEWVWGAPPDTDGWTTYKKIEMNL